jgi:hypothetical protein
MMEKKTHFGRAGEFYAMSELLLRGWNVAVPVVDIGDDVFVVDDNDKTTRRLQVKSSRIVDKSAAGEAPGTLVQATFNLSREQLRTQQVIELFYMFLIRLTGPERWRFLVIPRDDLSGIREAHVTGTGQPRGPGRRPLRDDQASGDTLTLNIDLSANEASGWKTSLNAYLDQWPQEFGIVSGGPGSVGPKEGVPATSSARDPRPSPDPGR